MDPELELCIIISFTVLSELYKAVLVFKWKRFGRSRPGMIWPQVEALWLKSSWECFSSNGSVWLKQKPLSYSWCTLWKDSGLLKGRNYRFFSCANFQDFFLWIRCVISDGHISLNASEERSFRESTLEICIYKETLSFQDDAEKDHRTGCIKRFYSKFGLQRDNSGGVHGAGGPGLGGGGGGGRRHDSSAEEGVDALVGYRVGMEDFQKSRIILNEEKGRVLVQLHKIHVVSVNFGLVQQTSLTQLGDGKFEVTIRLSLKPPDLQVGSLLQSFQFWAKQVKVRPRRVMVSKPIRKLDLNLWVDGLYCPTYLATMGDFPLEVFLETFTIMVGWIRMFRWREVKPMRMSTSFSPGTLLGTARPAKTSELKLWDRNMFGGNSFYLTLQHLLAPKSRIWCQLLPCGWRQYGGGFLAYHSGSLLGTPSFQLA